IGTTHPSRESPASEDAHPHWGVWQWLFRHQRLLSLLMSAQVELQSQLLAALEPLDYLHLDLELGPDDEAGVHMVRADEAARRTLERAAATLLDRLDTGDLDTLENMLSRRARRLVMRTTHGS